MPSGCAPVQATLRAASATAALPPSYGSSRTYRLLQSVLTAMPNPSPRTRNRPASPPGAITVPAWTVESYCSKTHRLLATDGESRIWRSASDGVGSREPGAGFDVRSAAIRGSFRIGIVDGAILHEPLARDLDDDLAFPQAAIHPVVGHGADRRGVQLPLGGNGLDFLHAIRFGHDEHPLLGFGEQDLVRRHP